MHKLLIPTLFALGFALPASALPVPALLAPNAGESGIIQVYGGCGPYGHRGPYGGCRAG